MRKFYIFNINEEFKSLETDSPYHLFKTFESIYNLRLDEQNYGIELYEKIVNPIDKINLNNLLFKTYYNNDHYSKYQDYHIYNNYYNDEKTRLRIGKAYLTIETTSIYPEFFTKLKENPNYFVCDFINQDYFWLESIA